MEILFFNFLLYTISGLWRPVQWSSKRSKLLYNVFTFLTMYLLIYVVLTHIMYIILVVKNFEDLASCSFFSASLTSLLFKAITVISRRDQIINLIQILQEEPCKARDKEEIDIEMKFDRSISHRCLHLQRVCRCGCRKTRKIFFKNKNAGNLLYQEVSQASKRWY